MSIEKLRNNLGEYQNNLFGEKIDISGRTKLSEKFIFNPFSVLDTRQGSWQHRKKEWKSILNFESHKGREQTKTTGSLSGSVPGYYKKKESVEKMLNITLTHEEFQTKYLPAILEKSSLKFSANGGILSIFDPTLTELAYRWFCPEKGTILDPFAGGSVRGIIAGFLEYNYLGIDLSEKQIQENIAQSSNVVKDEKYVEPKWIVGNSLNIDKLVPPDFEADFIFSCPPYFDLEKYTDNSEDLSNLNYEEFSKQYEEIIIKSCKYLKENRFACFVVGEIRNREDGFYRNFVGLTVNSFLKAGLKYYNEMILLNTGGSLPMRVSAQFDVSKKIGKQHQNILVFYKGNDTKQIRILFDKNENTNIL